jgi:hypothetical protein
MATVTWDQAAKRAEESGGGNFLRLTADKEKAVVALVDGPVEVEESFWNETTGRGEPFTEEHRAKGKTPRVTFKLNVFVRGEKKNKILGTTAACFKDFTKVKSKYSITKCWFEIERHGAKGDTKTTYTILPDDDMTDEDRKMIAAAPLLDLKAGEDSEDATTDMNSHGKAQTNGTAEKMAELIDSTTAGQIVGRLKILPKDKIDSFLKHFKIQQVKTLRSSSLPEVLAMLASLEAPPAPAAATNGNPVEVDPFS